MMMMEGEKIFVFKKRLFFIYAKLANGKLGFVLEELHTATNEQEK